MNDLSLGNVIGPARSRSGGASPAATGAEPAADAGPSTFGDLFATVDQAEGKAEPNVLPGVTAGATMCLDELSAAAAGVQGDDPGSAEESEADGLAVLLSALTGREPGPPVTTATADAAGDPHQPAEAEATSIQAARVEGAGSSLRGAGRDPMPEPGPADGAPPGDTPRFAAVADSAASIEDAATGTKGTPAAGLNGSGRSASGGGGPAATRSEGGDPASPPAAARAAGQINRLEDGTRRRIEREPAPTNAAMAARSDFGQQQALASPRSDGGWPQPAAASGWTALNVSSPPPGSPAQFAVAAPLGSPGFVEEFASRVTLLARGGVQRAELSLKPAELGPVQVSIDVRGSEATLLFTAQQAATRIALEEALPRLREMLNAQGLQLADARVGTQAGDGSSRDHHRERESADATSDRPQANAAGTLAATMPARPRSLRLIDDIA